MSSGSTFMSLPAAYFFEAVCEISDIERAYPKPVKLRPQRRAPELDVFTNGLTLVLLCI